MQTENQRPHKLLNIQLGEAQLVALVDQPRPATKGSNASAQFIARAESNSEAEPIKLGKTYSTGCK